MPKRNELIEQSERMGKRHKLAGRPAAPKKFFDVEVNHPAEVKLAQTAERVQLTTKIGRGHGEE